MTTEIDKYIAKMPESYRNTYKKAQTGKSRTCAVRAKCADCNCWDRTEIQNCPCTTCPLYLYNPYRKSKEKANRKALAQN